MNDLLKKLGGLPFRYHGNGFVQVQLTATHRLHIWHHAIKPIPNHNAPIHDHRFDMQSEILVGSIEHVVYEQPIGYRTDRTQIYDVWRLDKDDVLVPTYSGVAFDETQRYVLTADSVYYFMHHHFHQSIAVPSCPVAATLMQKTEVHDMEPRVLCPAEERPMNAFDPKYAPSQEAQMLAIIDAFDAMSARARDALASVLS